LSADGFTIGFTIGFPLSVDVFTMGFTIGFHTSADGFTMGFTIDFITSADGFTIDFTIFLLGPTGDPLIHTFSLSDYLPLSLVQLLPVLARILLNEFNVGITGF